MPTNQGHQDTISAGGFHLLKHAIHPIPWAFFTNKMIVFPAAFSVVEKKKRKANQGQEDTLHAVRFMLTLARGLTIHPLSKKMYISAPALYPGYL